MSPRCRRESAIFRAFRPLSGASNGSSGRDKCAPRRPKSRPGPVNTPSGHGNTPLGRTNSPSGLAKRHPGGPKSPAGSPKGLSGQAQPPPGAAKGAPGAAKNKFGAAKISIGQAKIASGGDRTKHDAPSAPEARDDPPMTTESGLAEIDRRLSQLNSLPAGDELRLRSAPLFCQPFFCPAVSLTRKPQRPCGPTITLRQRSLRSANRCKAWFVALVASEDVLQSAHRGLRRLHGWRDAFLPSSAKICANCGPKNLGIAFGRRPAAPRGESIVSNFRLSRARFDPNSQRTPP